MVSKLEEYDPGCSSRIRTRIRILTFYPSRIQGSKNPRVQGSKNPRIPDLQHWFLEPDPDLGFVLSKI